MGLPSGIFEAPGEFRSLGVYGSKKFVEFCFQREADEREGEISYKVQLAKKQTLKDIIFNPDERFRQLFQDWMQALEWRVPFEFDPGSTTTFLLEMREDKNVGGRSRSRSRRR